MFSNLVDNVFDYYLTFEVDGDKYDVHCRVIASVQNVEFPSYESCDVLTCISAKSGKGATLNGDEWKDLLYEHKKEADFWDSALDTFVLLQISLLTTKPIKA